MPNKYNNILEYKYGEKSLKTQFLIELGIECILKKEHSCQNNSQKSYTERKASMNLQAGQCLRNIHLIHQKINFIITEE